MYQYIHRIGINNYDFVFFFPVPVQVFCLRQIEGEVHERSTCSIFVQRASTGEKSEYYYYHYNPESIIHRIVPEEQERLKVMECKIRETLGDGVEESDLVGWVFSKHIK
jgi:hypothetical protein